jgi:hypothetical protein
VSQPLKVGSVQLSNVQLHHILPMHVLKHEEG